MTLLAQILMPTDDTITANIAVNTLHFEKTAGETTDWVELIVDGNTNQVETTGIHTALTTMWESLTDILSSALDSSMFRVKYIDLDNPAPNYPIVELDMIGLSSTQTTAEPAEVAVCGSYEGAKVQGLAQARRRGRMYVGPLGGASIVNSTNGRVGLNVQNVITDAMAALNITGDGDSGWEWVVYSPTAGSSTRVTNGWCDDAFDTQRRRGVEPSSRVTWAN